MSVAKGKAYDDLYQRLGTKEGEKDIYRMARIRERKTSDINQIKCIKDGTDRLLVKDEEIMDRWRKYWIFGLNTLASAGILHTRRCFSEGTLPVHSSYSVLGTDLLGTLLRIWMAIFNASIHKLNGKVE